MLYLSKGFGVQNVKVQSFERIVFYFVWGNCIIWIDYAFIVKATGRKSHCFAAGSHVTV